MLGYEDTIQGLDAGNLTNPEGDRALEGGGIAGTFYPHTAWIQQ
jgi:hypothetical protein